MWGAVVSAKTNGDSNINWSTNNGGANNTTTNNSGANNGTVADKIAAAIITAVTTDEYHHAPTVDFATSDRHINAQAHAYLDANSRCRQ